MADAVTTSTILDDGRNHIVHLTSISDSTGESAVVKVDASAVAAAFDGGAPVSFNIEQVEWNIQGFTYVSILWDATTPVVALLLNGSGYKDFRGIDRGAHAYNRLAGLVDPRATGTTGDIKLTSIAVNATDTYDITLWLTKLGT